MNRPIVDGSGNVCVVAGVSLPMEGKIVNFKVLRSISTLGLAGLLVLGSAAPGLARESTPTPPAPEPSYTGIGSLLLSEYIDVPAEAGSEEDRIQREKLEALRGTQSEAELQELATSEATAVLLYDMATGTYLAGYEETEPEASTMAISPRGPGCATGDACLTVNKTQNYGYYGSGSLSSFWSNVTRIGSGNLTTTFWYNNAGTFLAPNKTMLLGQPATFNKITRS